MAKVTVYTDGGCMGYHDENATGSFAYLMFEGYDITKRFEALSGIVTEKGKEIGNKFDGFGCADGTIWYKDEDITLSAKPQINTTNNRMEMIAVISALKQVKLRYGLGTHVRLYSDSGYVVKGVNDPSYSRKWMANGWINSKKQPVENKDLWIKLLAEIKGLDLELINIKGHGKNKNTDHNYYNNICDSLCTHIINQQLGR